MVKLAPGSRQAEEARHSLIVFARQRVLERVGLHNVLDVGCHDDGLVALLAQSLHSCKLLRTDGGFFRIIRLALVIPACCVSARRGIELQARAEALASGVREGHHELVESARFLPVLDRRQSEASTREGGLSALPCGQIRTRVRDNAVCGQHPHASIHARRGDPVCAAPVRVEARLNVQQIALEERTELLAFLLANCGEARQNLVR
eukprot:3411554-Rhodomonas_salina.2